MRADYLDGAATKYKKGLKRLAENSLFYTQANLELVPTETAPGHATVMTGKPPGETGIIGNTWWDRETGKTIDSLDDENFQVGPGHLKKKTLGDWMVEKDSHTQVVALSFKDRSAIFMGGKKPTAVVWFDNKTKKMTSSRAYGAEPSWLEKFNNRFHLNAPTPTSLATDILTFELVKTALEECHLGEDEHCDLLAVSFSGTGFLGQTFGPDSKQIKDQLNSLDTILGNLLDLLEKKTNGNFILALTSDHGVLPIPESVSGKRMGAKRVFKKTLEKQLEEACQRLYPEPKSKWVQKFLNPDVYLNKDLIKKRKLNWGRFLIQVQGEWKKIPNVAMIYFNNPLIDQDKYSQIFQRSFFPGRSGDLFLRMKPGILVTDQTMGTSTGSPYGYDTHIPLLFYGKGFPTERNETPVSNEILAPTLAHSMGVYFE